MLRIGIDVMGGDNPPDELVKGCIEASKLHNAIVVICGDEKIIRAESEKYDFDKKKIEILPSTEVITMDEHPGIACRKKRNSSMMIGLRALKDGTIDSFFTPGNTGATLTGSLMTVGRIKGVKRPAIGSPIPSVRGHILLLDAGANVDCTWKYLRQFAVMGNLYYRYIYNVQAPKVGILNIGEEEEKGNELTKRAFKEFTKLPINFIGHVEPSDCFEHKCDIAVCDGFAGNILLKTAEGVSKLLRQIIRQELSKNVLTKVAGLGMKGAFDEIKNQTDARRYGGAPLLGVARPVMIGHGGSNSESVISAVRTCIKRLETDITGHIQEEIKEIG